MHTQLVPPAAAVRPVVHAAHGDRRDDEFAWLRDLQDPAVRAHLEAENAYTEAMLQPTEPLRERLYEEIVARIRETDVTAPVPHGGWLYYSRTEEGLQYPIHCRRAAVEASPEQVILDQNVLAAGHGYLRVGDVAVSPDHRLLAYTVDHSGGEVFTVRFRDLESGHDLPDVVERAYYSLAWANDSTTLFFMRPDDAMRPWQCWRHRVGMPTGDDTLVLQEDDERFHAEVARTRSGGLIVIALSSAITSEAHVVPADAPLIPPRIVEPRRQGVEYTVDHHGDRLFIVTNDEAVNFRLMEAPVADWGRARWQEVIGHRDDVKLDSIDCFVRHLALHERAGGLRRVRVLRLSDMTAHEVSQPESVCTVTPGDNREWDTDTVRFGYSSLITPQSVVEYGMETGTRTVIKEQPVLGGYDRTQYLTRRLWANGAGGVQVPISVVHRREVALDGRAPALLYGYGSYEISTEPTFSSTRLSLLDRGAVCAIAHVRGGGEMGRRWYESGKLLHKRNTFTDFISCADHLVAHGYTDHDRLVLRGGSAGGLLMGATVNLRPDLAAVVVAQVPFVDCLTTMLDASLPLTAIEWEEWGNPQDPETYAYMKSYSPYDNIAEVEHPAILVTAGLNDPRVGYWEPAKWVARLRARTTGERPVLLKTELGAGHAGPSGRYEAWREEALILAFVLDRLPGWHEPAPPSTAA